ncbi:MAG: hypothetical protein JXA33_12780, partial [Anaerolineae bacterium]|nr:hypothetical protein [Anaerolineae bacterium]
GGVIYDAVRQYQQPGGWACYNPIQGLLTGMGAAALVGNIALLAITLPYYAGLGLQGFGLLLGNVGLWNLGTNALFLSGLLTYLTFSTEFYAEIVGFRGLGHDAPAGESPLIKLGHVGTAYSQNPGEVSGFRPSSAAEAEYGDDLLNMLGRGDSVPGTIHDDTGIFNRANELANQGVTRADGTNSTVYRWRIPLSRWDYASKYWQTHFAGTGKYQLPPGTAQNPVPMPAGVNNCATWPREIGLPLPENTGWLQFYIERLKELGGGAVWP